MDAVRAVATPVPLRQAARKPLHAGGLPRRPPGRARRQWRHAPALGARRRPGGSRHDRAIVSDDRSQSAFGIAGSTPATAGWVHATLHPHGRLGRQAVGDSTPRSPHPKAIAQSTIGVGGPDRVSPTADRHTEHQFQLFVIFMHVACHHGHQPFVSTLDPYGAQLAGLPDQPLPTKWATCWAHGAQQPGCGPALPALGRFDRTLI